MIACIPFPTATVSSGIMEPIDRRSVHEHGLEEARRHKWIVSEKAGRDLGEAAIRNWVREHWNGFLRDRWLEHLQGRTYWIELDHDDFGLLKRAFLNSPLFDEIIQRLKKRCENLDILCWAIDNHLPMEQVLDILEHLDINSRRIEFQVEQQLSKSS